MDQTTTLPPEPLLREGHRVSITAAQARSLGYWMAFDDRGYEYVVGSQIHRLPDGSRESHRTDCWGKTRRFLHSPDGKVVETTPETMAEQWAQAIPAKLRSKPWLLPDGSPPSRDNGVGHALDRLRGWAQTYLAGKHRLSVWLHGEPGRGKTQASLWAGGDLATAGRRVERVECAEVVRRLRATYGADPTLRTAFDDDLRRWCEAEVLVLDDVGAEAQAEDARAVLFQIIDTRLIHDRVTLATSNLSMADLTQAKIDPRLVSRLSSYHPIGMPGPDHRTPKSRQGALV